MSKDRKDDVVDPKPEEGAQAPSEDSSSTKQASSASKPKVPKQRHPVHPTKGEEEDLSPVERIRRESEEKQAKAQSEAVKAAARAEELARLAELRKVTLDELDKEGRKLLESMPAVKIRNAVEERRIAMMDEIKQWRPRTLGESLAEESIGVWKSDRAVKKLRLNELPAGAELVYDQVPEPGASINGVVFSAGSYQLLPQHIWDGILGRIGERRTSERNFYYPTRKPVQIPGKVFDAKQGPPPMWVR